MGLTLITFAVASQYTHVDDNRYNMSLPGEVYFKWFQSLLPNMLAEPSLESIQSCLLTTTYLIATHGSRLSYNYIHEAMRMAIALGLHQSGTNSNFPTPLREVCNRVLWTTYINERYEHRPAAIMLAVLKLL
jgi:hypothetical protein